MKKYNLSIIMKRAWEIKKEADRHTLNSVRSRESNTRLLKPSEKALFSLCLKMAWEEAGKVDTYVEKFEVSAENAKIIIEKETELEADYAGIVSFKIWCAHGKMRAYYTCSRWSKFQNSKKFHFVELAI